ncbi:MAG TPA: hypothetical protein VH143_26055 [Kofleriaceae bacterium]|nr:hypothetical protein [Kofleriaceae bacterium]
MRAAELYIVTLALCAGCLDVPAGKQPQCTTNADCDVSVGEVCDQGACWGGPPAGQFAAIVVPPSARPDLISTEVPAQALASDGDLGNVSMGAAITVAGRVEPFCASSSNPCSGDSIGATVTVSRPSRFPGGPGFTAVATATDGVARGTDSFSISVPPTMAGDEPFTITFTPTSTGAAPPNNGTVSPAELAPPLRMTLQATSDTELGTITLGNEDSPVITGTLTDAQGQPLEKYRVVALGHLGDANAPLTQVSTVDYTTTGQYSVTLAGCSDQTCEDIIGTVTLEASPYDTTVAAPTLYAPALQPVSTEQTLSQPAAMGNPISLAIPIQGLNGDGAVAAVSGAHVIVTGTFVQDMVGLGSAVVQADVQTGDDGIANVQLLDGNAFAANYAIEVIPPANSALGVYAKPLALDGSPIRVPSRLALSGSVVDGNGKGVGNISITATPSLRFQWSLDAGGQSLLAEIPPATAVTDASGAFTLDVDPILDTVWAYYDLDFTVPDGVQAADWTHTEIAIPRDPTQTSYALAAEPLPATAFMHGTLVDAAGIAVGAGELRIFEIETDNSLCAQVTNPPASCAIPAQPLGHGTSAANGTVQLALPRMPDAP